MSDDIVTRLRMSADLMQGFPQMKAQDFNAEWVIEAADEIERLRKMAYAMIDELRQNGGYEPYTTQMLFNEFYEQAVRGE